MDRTDAPQPPAERLLTSDQFAQVGELLPSVGSVELKASVPDTDRRSVVRRLGMDVLNGQIRQVTFFDTPDLALNRAGVLVRARRIQRRAGDVVVKLRPVVVEDLPDSVRSAEGFSVELDVMPGGYVRSGTLKRPVGDRKLRRLLAGERPLASILSGKQRALLDAHAPADTPVETLVPLGPVTVFKLKFEPPGLPRRLVAELWLYPDGSRVLEMSTKCMPAEALAVAEETRDYLTGQGVDLAAEQQTKTASALRYFSGELTRASHG